MLRNLYLLLLLGAGLFLDFKCVDAECAVSTVLYRTDTALITHLDNRGAAAIPPGGDMPLREAYGLRLQLVPSLDDTLETADPFCSEFFPASPVENIRIRTVLPFDPAHPAGEDVTDLFRAALKGSSVPGNNSPLLEYRPVAGSYDQLNSGPPPLDRLPEVDFILISPPPGSGYQQFEIEIKLADTMLLVRSDSIFLK